MRNLLLLLITGILICAPGITAAQNSVQNNDAVTVSQDQISELIETLESETARTEFIDNLKTLKEASTDTDQPADESQESIGELLGLEDLIANYQDFLKKHDLNSSTVGQTVLTLLTFFAALLLAFLVRKSSLLLKTRLGKVRDKFSLPHQRFNLYAKLVRYLGYVVILFLTIYTITNIWQANNVSWLASLTDVGFWGKFFNLLLIAAIAVILWEIISTALQYWMVRASGRHATRLKTLLPVAQNVLLVIFIILFGFVILSELGINILPLMAGAGIAGIAIGFAAQTLVADFLKGFTIILEDLIQVGDVAKVGDRIGLVEKITIRKVQLRDLAGIVYTVPFSEINIIENWTKEFSYYIFDIGVAYRENTDEVVEYMKEVDEEIREDENFKDLILEPLEVFGVDALADSAVVIKGRVKTKPIQQWTVGREYMRRFKHKFDEMGVEIPFPHQTIYFGEDKDGSAPAARLMIEEESKKKLPKPQQGKKKNTAPSSKSSTASKTSKASKKAKTDNAKNADNN